MPALKSLDHPIEPGEGLVIDPDADRDITEDPDAAETGEVIDRDADTDEAGGERLGRVTWTR